MDAVIEATARTPIGPAIKGSMVECRPDDLSAAVIDALFAKVPNLDPDQVEDIMWGCANPEGEHGDNIAPVAGLPAGVDVPGTTVNRFCSSSLQTIRMATHAIAAGEGDVFISGGVDCVSRYAISPTNFQNPKFTEAEAETERRAKGDAEPWSPVSNLPDIYIDMGQTAMVTWRPVPI